MARIDDMLDAHTSLCARLVPDLTPRRVRPILIPKGE